MRRVEEVHVLRHQVLVEGRSRRQVARELGISRNTVRRYLTLAEPVRIERAAGTARLRAGAAAPR